MSNQFGPVCGHFVALEKLMPYLPESQQIEFNELPDPVHDEEEVIEFLTESFFNDLDKVVDRYALTVLSIEDEFPGAELEVGKVYLAFDVSEFYELTPKSRLTNLQKKGIEPFKDAFCRLT